MLQPIERQVALEGIWAMIWGTNRTYICYKYSPSTSSIEALISNDASSENASLEANPVPDFSHLLFCFAIPTKKIIYFPKCVFCLRLSCVWYQKRRITIEIIFFTFYPPTYDPIKSFSGWGEICRKFWTLFMLREQLKLMRGRWEGEAEKKKFGDCFNPGDHPLIPRAVTPIP